MNGMLEHAEPRHVGGGESRARTGRPALPAAWLFIMSIVLAACGGAPEQENADVTAGSSETNPGTSPPAQMENVNASFATFYPPENWQMVPIQEYYERLNEASGEAIEVEYHWAGSLLGATELSTGVADGIADMAVYVPGWNPDEYPVDVWIAFLGFLNESKPLVGMLQAIGASLEWSFENEAMQEEFERNRVVPLAARYQILDDYSLFCREPVTTLEQARGKRVRIGGAAWAEEARNLDMEPVEMPGPEIFEAFERGIIDCMMGSPPDFAALGLTDVGQHFIQSEFTGFTSYGMIAGQDFWNELSPDAKQVMWENVPYYLEDIVQSYLSQYRAFFTTLADEKGLQFHSVDEAVKSEVEKYHDEIIDTIAEKAPAAVNDPQAAVDRYIELHEKWLNIVQDLGYDHEFTTWPEWIEANGSADVDLSAWREAIWEEIYAPRAPSS